MKSVMVSLLGALLLFSCSAKAAQQKRAPNFQFTTLTGAKVKIDDLHGSIAVVNFWATWCGPCREEMPLLSRLTQQYAGKKVRFISVSADEDPGNKKNRAKIDRFLAEQKPAMEIWLGADLDSLGRTGLGNILPGTLILDQNGMIVSRIAGEVREQDVTGPIDWLLNGRIGPEPAELVKRY